MLKRVNYKWIVFSNMMFGILLATIDAAIVLIAMPDIFRGIRLDPLQPANSFYLLWMLLGYMIVSSVLVVGFGRLGDQYGRVRLYTLGYAFFTLSSLLLSIDWMHGTAGGDWLVAFRITQGIGAASLIGTSPAILTDAFPSNQRGLALGTANVVGMSGVFIGLVLGGVLAPVDWRLVFVVPTPLGLLGTIWSYRSLRELGIRSREPIDWPGNITFAAGLVLVMIGITYGIRPYHGHPMSWLSPFVLTCLGAGSVLLALFVRIELRATSPMFRLALFRLRTFTCGVLASFLAALARGGVMFMCIVWLQGIWLPQHGYSFAETPFWAGILMMPMTAGVMFAGPIAGILSDHFGPRAFATGGMIGMAVSFVLLELVPIDFSYPMFAALLSFQGLCVGMFAAPNRAAVMNSLPAEHRGAGGGMNQTFQNSAQVLSLGVFFTLMIVGLAASLPHDLAAGLAAHGVPAADAQRLSNLPPVSVIFAAFLGYNPAKELLGPHVLSHLSHHNAAVIAGRRFFPHLISGAFQDGLHVAFSFAAVSCLAGAVASWSRGRRELAPVAHATELTVDPAEV